MQSTISQLRTKARHEWHQGQQAVANDDDALLAMPTVCALAGIGKSLIYEKVKAGTFPKPVKIGQRVTRWRAGDVRAWLRALSQVEEGN